MSTDTREAAERCVGGGYRGILPLVIRAWFQSVDGSYASLEPVPFWCVSCPTGRFAPAVISAEDIDGFFIRYPSKCRTRGRGQKHVRRVHQSVSRFVAYLGEAKLFDPLPRQETYQSLLDGWGE